MGRFGGAGLLLAVWGCVENGPVDPGEPVVGSTAFQSADPSYNGDRGYDDMAGGADAGATADAASDGGATPTDPEDPEDPERVIEEADIVKVYGDRLYALSAYRGLVIIDVSDPDDLAALGRYGAGGVPFEMYVRDGVAYVMYSSFGFFAYDEATGTSDWRSTSRLVTLDVSDPSEVVPLGEYDLVGEISDSRIVGDVLYAVAFEDGYCWRCTSGSPRTTITSLRVGDPSEIRLVDQVVFTEEGSWYGWRRSVAATTDRLFVSGMRWSSDWTTSGSTVRVVDISDPSGVMALGAEVPVAGQIESRWQMDEYEGVLRVVTQPGSGWGSAIPPVVETFAIESSASVVPLGRLTMTLPRPEDLRSVRFDGERAYAVTFQQTDPLFTIDLSDPANPVQRGELEIPGWLYHMEPRGDRMLALGFDDAGGSSLAVSLFDVSDLDDPRMLDRVNFGAGWGWMVEDQDRIHKAFRIFDNQGLILMPFAGWDTDGRGYYGAYRSGVQLIDFTRDDLTLRGTIPHPGFARRAFIHNGRLFAMSDERIESYDFTDRDRPAFRSKVILARSVYRVAAVAEHLVELVSDWWTSTARLDVLPATDPDGFEPAGTLDLAPLLPAEGLPYYYWSYGFSYWNSRLIANGDLAYLVWSEDRYCRYYDDRCDATVRTGVAVIDVSDPAAPRLRGVARFPFRFPVQYSGGYGAAVEAGETIVRVGSTLVFRTGYDYGWYWGEESDTALEVVDLSNPDRPRHAASFPLEDDHGVGMLQVRGDQVFTSHREPVAGLEGVVRFYLDRFDLSDPDRPRRLRAINVPGSLVDFDPAGGRLVTVDYRRTEVAVPDAYGCWDRGGDWSGWYDYETGTCTLVERSLNLSAVEGDRAVLQARRRFDSGRLSEVRVTPDRVFVGLSHGYGWYYDGSEARDPRAELITVTGLADGRLDVRSSVRLDGPYSRLFGALGLRAVVLADYPPAVSVYDATLPERTIFRRRTLLTGYAYDVQLHGDQVISANGPWGVQTIRLR
jgi:hypothetical protein